MGIINFGSRISLKEAAKLIAAIGDTNRVLLVGEKGVGKSSIMDILPEYLGSGYEYAYFDMGNKSEGDTAIPYPDKERKVMEFFVNAALKVHLGKPVVIMLDEFGKAPRSIQNMMHPLLEVRNPRIGDIPLPEGSIVFLTSNLSEEGVGDTFLEHTLDRLTRVEVAKPTPEEWLLWGAENNIHPALLAWVNQTPTVLASFRDADFDNDNPYVYNPKRVQGKFATPRSLQLASYIMGKRERFSDDTLLAALIGTVGEAAARDLQSYLAFNDQLPSRELILTSPSTAPIPESVGAIITLLFNLERVVDKDTIDPIMTYVNRMDAEHQAMFCITLARSPSKQTIAFRNKSFTTWAQTNQDIL
jgi:hypothetical protein